MITPNQFRSGLTIELENELYNIVEYQHVKPGKGGAFIRTKLKNLKTKRIIEKTFRPEEKFQEAFIEEKKVQYLYNSHDTYHFMDQENYEEISIHQEKLDGIVGYLKENMEVTAVYYKHELLEVNLPMFIVLKVTETEPGFKGDTAKGSYKPAKLETGATIQVPLFISENDLIKIDTRTETYVERA